MKVVAHKDKRKDLDGVPFGHLRQQPQDDGVDLLRGAKKVLLVKRAVGDEVNGLFLLASNRAAHRRCSIVEDMEMALTTVFGKIAKSLREI
jgi:hypothetical protein